MALELMPHQEKVLPLISSGKIVKGGVGSGKSVTILKYYIEKEMMNDIYIITTAKKRDSLEWERDAALLGIGPAGSVSNAGQMHIDSWNNISKYEDCEGFFIFDEQRAVGNGAWVKSFQRIAKNPRNFWVILSATPGDTWLDYIPVFVANGYYKNPTDFKRQHIIYAAFSRYPRIERFINTSKLERLKREVLIEMPFSRHTTRHHTDVEVTYDVELFQRALKDRWNVFTDEPARDQSALFAILRRISWGDRSRLEAVKKLMEKHPKLIVFYNYNYELHMLRELNDTWSDLYEVAEWNGHKKQPIPNSDNWVYLVQYTAGAEGWNCVETDAMIFYSLPYSYKKYEQGQGRIDRLNTPFRDLFYYNFSAKSMVDRAVRKSLDAKESFNEVKWARENLPEIEPWDGWNE